MAHPELNLKPSISLPLPKCSPGVPPTAELSTNVDDFSAQTSPAAG